MGEVQNDKQLRSEYRNLLEKAKSNKHNLISTDNNQLREILEEADNLHSRVSKPREQAVDSELFALVTEAGQAYVNQLARGGKAYTPADFIRRLKTHYVYDTDAQLRGAEDPLAMDWAAVGRTVAAFFKPAPVVYHMLGPMDARPKERRQVVRQKRKAVVGEAVRPEELQNIGDTEKQETDKNMEEMWEVLRGRRGRANLLHLVMNHRSFAQTVENLFTLSFLVRDQRVELHANEELGTEVLMRTKQQGARQQEGGAGEKERVQFVVELDFDAWEEWRDCVEPDAVLMRDRPEHHHTALHTLLEQQAQGDAQQQQQRQQQQRQQQRGQASEEVDGGEEEEGAQRQSRSQAKRSRQR